MTWKLVAKQKRLLAGEEGAAAKGWGGKLNVCLVYPNRYRVGMGNLGFQTVYALLNDQADILCDRAFLPDPETLREHERTGVPLRSLESQRPLAEFDIIAFSISFESDYLQLPPLFMLAGIAPLAADRTPSQPLVIAGGAAVFLNPEPVADFFDLACVGEAEAVLPPLLELLRGTGTAGRTSLLRDAARLPGIYVPSLYRVEYDGPRVVAHLPQGGVPQAVCRIWLADLDREATVSRLFATGTEFADMYLVEVSRGCPRGCRFCAAGFIYHPYRRRSLDRLIEAAAEGLVRRGKIGLVGAAVSDHPEIGELCRHILTAGGKVSVSSLRIDGLDEEMIRVLVASGHRTVALAPEGGSQRLRDLIRKGIDEEQILAACDRLVAAGILNLKLYFIIGLPSETEDDLAELAELVERVRQRVVGAARQHGRLGEVTLAINPFVPKPFTPFQWCGMEPLHSLERKGELLRRRLGRLANVRLQLESPREAYLQALLSRGDRRLARFLIRARELGSWRRAARELEPLADLLVQRDIPLDEHLPWEIIDGGPRERLEQEFRRAFADG